jgi:hypothetical protein
MPERWAKLPGRRQAAGVPGDLVLTTKPDLALAQLGRLIAAGLPAGWAAFDEVYTRSGKLREACQKAGLAYVGIVPCDFPITLSSGNVIRRPTSSPSPGAAGRLRKRSKRERTCSAGTSARPGRGTLSAGTPPCPRSPSLAAGRATGLLTPAQLAFKLRWSARRRRHQATARWHHHATRPAAAT